MFFNSLYITVQQEFVWTQFTRVKLFWTIIYQVEEKQSKFHH